MPTNPSIFKSYDVRGVYPLELNEESAFLIGRAFIKKTGAKEVVLGYDARLSGPSLLKFFAAGAKEEGAKVYSIGQCPTEVVYFAVGNYNFPAGAMITASHNPKEYNGFKMLQMQDGNIQMIRGKDLLETTGQIEEKSMPNVGEISKKDVWTDYLNYVLSFVNLEEISPLKVVIDASNGAGGIAIEKIKDKLGIEIVPLNFEPDGNFPNHSPNPLEKGSADKISKAVVFEKADFGIMFDGDADRIFLVDETGELVRADVVLLLLAKYFLEKNPGSAIAYNAICSKAVPEFIKKWGGNPIRTQVGFINVREGLLQNNGVMGGELSGHYCFKDYFYMDSGLIAFLSLLEIFSKDKRKPSEIVKELSPYAKGAELNFSAPGGPASGWKGETMEKIKQKYIDGKQDFLDGVTIEYKEWWFNARPSNTEPLLRLTIEADTPEILSEKQKELTELIAQ